MDLVLPMLPPWVDVFGGNLMLTVNKNVVCYPHKDSGNKGDNAVMFLGDYQGGELCTEDGQVFSERGVWHRYDGTTKLHWNNEIRSGTKYSVIAHCRADPYKMYNKKGRKAR